MYSSPPYPSVRPSVRPCDYCNLQITSAELESGVDCIPCNSCSFSIRIDVPAAAVEDSEDEQEQEQEREGEEGAGGR